MKSILKTYIRSAILIFAIFYSYFAGSQTWSSLAGGMNGYVYASAVYNGNLIVAGQFTLAGIAEVNNIASWNGTTWSALGSGLNDRVDALIVFNGELIAGGQFTNAGAVSVNHLASWNGTAWSNHLGGLNSRVAALTIYATNLIAGGYFTDANGTPANYIASYNNATGWSSLGSGMGGSQGKTVALTVYGGELIAGGFFTTAGGTSAEHIAKWNGTTWSSLGNGVSGVVYSLGRYYGKLVAGGLFTAAGDVPANNIATWDGIAWSPLGTGTDGPIYQYVLALSVYNGNLIAGGLFSTAGGATVNGIAKWNGSAWSDLDGGVFLHGSSVYGVYTLSVYGNDLVAGGIFDKAGSVDDVGFIAAYNEPDFPVMLDLQDETVGPGISVCYNASQTITVAGSATTFVVKNGGVATLIAGQNILFLPGTTVIPGGYLHGSITTSGQYCGTYLHPLVNIANTKEEYAASSMASFFRVYPNPSNGIFFLEINSGLKSAQTYAEVFNMQGDRVLSFLSKNELTHQFSLDRCPAGVYFIRLVSETKTEIVKIIKRE